MGQEGEITMKTRIFLPLAALAGALSFGGISSAQQSGTPDEAKALLAKAVAAVKANRADALAKFDDPDGGFRDGDLYVFCVDIRSGIALTGPLRGMNAR